MFIPFLFSFSLPLSPSPLPLPPSSFFFLPPSFSSFPPSPPFLGIHWGSALRAEYFFWGTGLPAKYCRQDFKYSQGSGNWGADMAAN